MKKKIVTLVILSILLIIFGGGYLGGRWYFRDHYYPRTSINGVDVSVKTKAEALQMMKEELAAYNLGILSDESPDVITADQCQLENTGTQEVEKILDDQDENMWFKEIIQPREYKAMGLKLNEDKLKEVCQALTCMTPANPRESTDARIEYDEIQKAFVIINETIGNHIDFDKFYEGVKTAILSGENVLDLNTNEYYLQPKYFATDQLVVDTKAALDQSMTTVINYKDFDLDYTVTGEDIHKYIQVSKDFKISYDKEGIKQFVQDNISPVFNTVGTERTINSPGSGTFKASGGTYGWQVGLIDEREAMIKNIEAGGEVTREPMYLQDAKIKDRTNDIGDTYVDVNIEKQKLWVVDKGKVVLESDFVSGDCTNGHDTDKGIFQVERNERNYRMQDYNVTVSYWMPFNLDQGEGFHDASWRGSFGGTIYMGSGSHGCVNLPKKIAKKMFGIVSKGFPVIVH